jgi:hypothetical protein
MSVALEDSSQHYKERSIIELNGISSFRRLFFLSVVVCRPHKCLLTNYKRDRIYWGSGVEQLQPVAAILTGVPILPRHNSQSGSSPTS